MFDGIVCLVKLEPFEKRVVLPHEETLKGQGGPLQSDESTFCNFFSSIYSSIWTTSVKFHLLAGYTAAPPAQAFTDDEGA